jgi:hypothetical protein
VRQLPYSFILLIFAGIFPITTFAQLSSSNYQVDVQYVGEEGGGYATSTSYQLEGSEGTPYGYNGTAVTPTTTTETGGNTTGSRARSASTTASTTSSASAGGVDGGIAVAPSPGSTNSPVPDEENAELLDKDNSSNGRGEGNNIPNSETSVIEQEGGTPPENLSPRDVFIQNILEQPIVYGGIFLLFLILIIFIAWRYLRSRE